MTLTIYDIINFINKRNVEEPKNPAAKPNDLILVDNRVTLTVKNHLGNLIAVVAEGSWGSGKTWSGLKLYHDLKNIVKITYVPVRYSSGVIKPITKVNGVNSHIATVISMALCKPETLARQVKEVITNAQDTGINIDRELDEVMNDCYLILKENDQRHLVILDEFEEGIKGYEDIEALIKSLIILRNLYDRYGSMRITMLMLILPLSVGSRVYDLVRDTSIVSYIKSRLSRPDNPEGRYVLDKVVFINLDDNVEDTKDMLKEIANITVRLVNSVFKNQLRNIARIKGVEDAVNYIVKMAKWIRFGRDLLVNSLARAIIDSANTGQEVNLYDYVLSTLYTDLGLSSPNDLEDILIKGKFNNIDFDSIRKTLYEVINELRGDLIDDYSELEFREERGFTSLTLLLKKRVEVKKGVVKDIDIPLTFWLRFTNIKRGSISKANKIFKDKYIIILSPEGCRHSQLTSVNLQFKLQKIIYLPRELMYYLVAGSKIRDEKISSSLKERFNQTYKNDIIHSIRILIHTVSGIG